MSRTRQPALLDPGPGRGHGLGLISFIAFTACAPLPPPAPPPHVPQPVRELTLYEEEKRAEAGCPPLRWMSELEPVAQAYLQSVVDSTGRTLRPDVRQRLVAEGVAFHRFSVLEGRADAGWIMVETWRRDPDNRETLMQCLNTHTAVVARAPYWVQLFIQSAAAQQTRIP